MRACVCACAPLGRTRFMQHCDVMPTRTHTTEICVCLSASCSIYIFQAAYYGSVVRQLLHHTRIFGGVTVPVIITTVQARVV